MDTVVVLSEGGRSPCHAWSKEVREVLPPSLPPPRAENAALLNAVVTERIHAGRTCINPFATIDSRILPVTVSLNLPWCNLTMNREVSNKT